MTIHPSRREVPLLRSKILLPLTVMALVFRFAMPAIGATEAPDLVPRFQSRAASTAIDVLAVSPDGRLMAVGHKQTYVWDLETRQLLTGLGDLGSNGKIRSLAFSQDGRRLAVAQGHEVQVWEIATGRLDKRLSLADENDADEAVWAAQVAFGSDSQSVAIIKVRPGENGFTSQTLVVWRLEEAGAGALWKPAPGEAYRQFALSADHTLLAAVGKDHIQLWDLRARRSQWRIAVPQAFSIGAHRTRRGFAVGCLDGTITLLDPETGSTRSFLERSNAVHALAFSADDQQLAILEHRGLGLWNVEKRAHVSDVFVYGAHFLPQSTGWNGFYPDNNGFAYLPKGKIIALSTRSSGVQLCDGSRQAASNYVPAIVATVPGEPPKVPYEVAIKGLTESILRVDFTPGGTHLIGANGSKYDLVPNFDGRSLAAWDLRTGKCAVLAGASNRYALLPNERVATLSSESRSVNGKTVHDTVMVWDLTRERLVRTLSIPPWATASGPEPLNCQDVAGDLVSGHIATYSVNPQQTKAVVDVLNAHTGRPVKRFVIGNTGATRIRFSRGGRDVLLLDPIFNHRPLRLDLDTGKISHATAEVGELLDRESANPLAGRMPSEARPATAWATSPDGKTIALADDEGRIRLVDAKDAVDRLTLLRVGHSDSVILDGDYHYMGSPGALRGFGFQAGDQSYPAEQFDLSHNRPDLVLEKLSEIAPVDPALLEAYRRIVQQRLASNAGDAAPTLGAARPTCRFGGHDVLPITEATSVRVPLVATGAGRPIVRMEVSVNGVPLYGMTGKTIQGSLSLVEPLDVPLVYGDNRIEAAVVDSAGQKSLKRVLYVKRVGAPPTRRRVVIAIGVSSFNSPHIPPLAYAAKDARDVAQFFKRINGMPAEVHVLEDGSATRESLKALRPRLEALGVDDEVVVFMAGHGMLDQHMRYFFVTSDTELARPEPTAITFDDLNSLLDGIPPRRRLLLMDTCHSGRIDAVPSQSAATAEGQSRGVELYPSRAIAEQVPIVLDEVFADVRQGSGATVLAAAGGREFSYEQDALKNGVFTYVLLDSITRDAAGHHRGDLSKRDNVFISDLRHFLAQEVDRLTDGKQKPGSRESNPDGDFPLLHPREGH